jgi:eukaryotic-like serine/threonine-protein kinase
MKISLLVEEGAGQGAAFEFAEHDLFLFGRAKTARLRADNDPFVSRHQLLIEINPPVCRLRDLGSKNGTYVNGKKHGGRERDPAGPPSSLNLHDGDLITVGATGIRVSIEAVPCARCGRELKSADLRREGWVSGAYYCAGCRQDLVTQPRPAVTIDSGADHEPGAAAGKKVGPWELGRRLGRGELGSVHQARHQRTGAAAALKVIAPKRGLSAGALAAFSAESERTAKWRHANAVALLDRGEENNLFYFASELVEGVDLVRLLSAHRGQLALKIAAPIMVGALSGLAAAHAQGIVHRDLKPAHLFAVGKEGAMTAKISDFGIARAAQLAGLTTIIGGRAIAASLPYLPPDRLFNFRADQTASDVFSIAAAFHHLLTGQFVHDFTSKKDHLAVVLEDPVVPIRQRNAKLPAALGSVIDRALDKDPAHRFPDAGAMLAALKSALA